jgi:hypothetical protein
VIDGVENLGFPLSVHFEAAYGINTPAFETSRRCLRTGHPRRPDPFEFCSMGAKWSYSKTVAHRMRAQLIEVQSDTLEKTKNPALEPE